MVRPIFTNSQEKTVKQTTTNICKFVCFISYSTEEIKGSIIVLDSSVLRHCLKTWTNSTYDDSYSNVIHKKAVTENDPFWTTTQHERWVMTLCNLCFDHQLESTVQHVKAPAWTHWKLPMSCLMVDKKDVFVGKTKKS